MNLNFDVERINDINFNGKVGNIDLDIPEYAIRDLFSSIPIMDVFSNMDDDTLIEEVERRGYKIEEDYIY